MSTTTCKGSFTDTPDPRSHHRGSADPNRHRPAGRLNRKRGATSTQHAAGKTSKVLSRVARLVRTSGKNRASYVSDMQYTHAILYNTQYSVLRHTGLFRQPPDDRAPSLSSPHHIQTESTVTKIYNDTNLHLSATARLHSVAGNSVCICTCSGT